VFYHAWPELTVFMQFCTPDVAEEVIYHCVSWARY
jgi:hypothetical protein